MTFFDDAKNFVLDSLFPIYCLGCRTEGLFLCQSCQKKIPLLKQQQCIICRQISFNGLTHEQCRTSSTPDALISAFDYHNPLTAQAIIAGKYKSLPDIYKTLTQMSAEYIKQNNFQEMFDDAVLCPIPLAKQRLRWRGFNQAEIVCEVLSKKFYLPIEHLLERTKNTSVQKDLNREQRIKNITNSFVAGEVDNKNIILVDDVITTGTTLLEATKSLKENRAAQVICVTLARD